MEKITINRKEFYELMWSQPMTVLMKKYNLSNHILKNHCKQMNIPIPKPGHWMKIRFGKPNLIEPLPIEYTGENEITLNQKAEGENTSILSPLAIKQKEIESSLNLPIVVHLKLTSPDKLIVERIDAIKKYEETRKKGWQYAIYPSNTLSIDVSPGNYNRALRFMDALIKLARARGHNFICEGGTYIIVYGKKMQISLVERKKRTIVKRENSNWSSSEYSYSGILLIRFRERAYQTTDWSEGKLPIEKLLTKIMACIELKAIELKEYQIQLEKGWAEQREEQRIQDERNKLISTEIDNFKKLIIEANRWDQIKKIRLYIDDVEAKSQRNSNHSEEMKNWISWARKKVDWYEPKSNVDDELLSEIDKDTLLVKKKW